MKSEFYYTRRVYYTSVLGAECIALLCSVSRLASASFKFLIFNDVLVSSSLTETMLARGTKILVAPGEQYRSVVHSAGIVEFRLHLR